MVEDVRVDLSKLSKRPLAHPLIIIISQTYIWSLFRGHFAKVTLSRDEFVSVSPLADERFVTPRRSEGKALVRPTLPPSADEAWRNVPTPPLLRFATGASLSSVPFRENRIFLRHPMQKIRSNGGEPTAG